jgi:hypothetical protein
MALEHRRKMHAEAIIIIEVRKEVPAFPCSSKTRIDGAVEPSLPATISDHMRPWKSRTKLNDFSERTGNDMLDGEVQPIDTTDSFTQVRRLAKSWSDN